MYNGKYGKLRFGLKDGATKVVKINAELNENLWNISGFGETISFSTECLERVFTSFSLHGATLIEAELFGELQATANISTCYSVKAELKEDLTSKANADKIIYLIDDLHEEINVDCYLGKNIEMALNLEDDLNGNLFIGKNVFYDFLVAEQLNAEIAANVLEKQMARIEVTIPPNGELRIDSNVFNATMNGENILHLYNGDWIMISRDTTTLTVQTASGGTLVGQLLYTERYL